MTTNDRELLIRAVGQIEGVGLVVDNDNVRDALFCALEMLQGVIDRGGSVDGK